MGKVIEFMPSGMKHRQRLEELELEISAVIGDSEMIETDNEDIILDPVSEAKCDKIESEYRLELMKMGYGGELFE